MNDRRCDNDECPFIFEMQCIQPWFCAVGLTSCKDYRRTRKTPDELYAELLESEEEDETTSTETTDA